MEKTGTAATAQAESPESTFYAFCENRRKRSMYQRIVFAIFLIGAGALILLNNLHIGGLNLPSWFFTWKMFLVAFGFFLLLSRKAFSGFIMMAIGGYFLLPEALNIPQEDVFRFWPVLLILAGLAILFRRKHHHPGWRKHWKKHHWQHWEQNKEYWENWQKKNSTTTIENESYMHSTVIFGGETKKVSSYDFKGGKLTAVFGGLEVDLTNCYLSSDIEEHVIEVNVVGGGITLYISRDWNIKSEITPVMGGIEDDLRKFGGEAVDPAAEIILRGSIVMGGLEIKRK